MDSKVICLGEALIDFVPLERGLALKEVTHFKRCSGGAPGNLAAAVARQNKKAVLCAMVGNDPFGDFIIEELKASRVDVSSIVRSDKRKTALAFVSLTKEGERDFSFYLKGSAVYSYCQSDLPLDIFNENDILHFGSVGLLENPLKDTHKIAVSEAKKKKMIISFDPNLRNSIYGDDKKLRKRVIGFLGEADIVKVSIEELQFILEESDEEKAIAAFFASYPCKVLLISRGPKGSTLYTRTKRIDAMAYHAKVVDTTGAGDSFYGGFLSQILGKVTSATLEDTTLYSSALEYGSALASLVVEKEGALPMPGHDEVEERIKRGR